MISDGWIGCSTGLHYSLGIGHESHFKDLRAIHFTRSLMLLTMWLRSLALQMIWYMNQILPLKCLCHRFFSHYSSGVRYLFLVFCIALQSTTFFVFTNFKLCSNFWFTWIALVSYMSLYSFIGIFASSNYAFTLAFISPEFTNTISTIR